jgi:hypothetical protein
MNEDDYYDDIWTKVSKREGYNYSYCLSDEDFYIYMIYHCAKHFKSGGLGIRMLMDVYVYLNSHQNLDREYIDDNFNFELVKPFVIARNGELDVDTTMQEIMQGLKNMPKKKYNLNSLNIEIGEGVIIVNIPEHPALSMLTDNLRKITLKEKDFEDLIRNIKEQE